MAIRRIMIAIVGPCALAATLAAAPASAQSTIGRAAAVDPAARAQTGPVTQTLAVGTQVKANDRVVTDAAGRTRLLFLDRTTLDVGPNSSLVLDRFVFNPDQTASQASMNLVRGAFRFVSGASDKRAYEIRTPTATIAIRGTDLLFFVTASLTRILVLDGEITACNRISRRCETLDRTLSRNTITLARNGRNTISATQPPPLGAIQTARAARPDMAAGREMATGIVTSGLSAIGPVSPGLPNVTPTLLDPARRPVIGDGQPRGYITINLDIVAVGPGGEALSTQRRSVTLPSAGTSINATALVSAAVSASPSLLSDPAFRNATLLLTTPYGGSRSFSAEQVLFAPSPVIVGGAAGASFPVTSATVRVPVR